MKLSITVFVILLIIGILFAVRKNDNCEQAGWEYHWATDQCLPKDSGR